MLAAALVLSAFVLSGYVLRERRDALEASYRALSPAVPDVKAIEGAPYRGDVSVEAIDLPHSRKAIAESPLSALGEQTVKRVVCDNCAEIYGIGLA